MRNSVSTKRQNVRGQKCVKVVFFFFSSRITERASCLLASKSFSFLATVRAVRNKHTHFPPPAAAQHPAPAPGLWSQLLVSGPCSWSLLLVLLLVPVPGPAPGACTPSLQPQPRFPPRLAQRCCGERVGQGRGWRWGWRLRGPRQVQTDRLIDR